MPLHLDAIGVSTLTKADLVALLVDQRGLDKREAADLVEAIFDVIFDRILVGEDVRLSDFGNFQVRAKGARPGRNPQTGQAVQIPPRRVVTFQAGPKLKARMKTG